MKNNFPVIRDVDGVLAHACEGTRGGTKTIQPPGYTLAVTNPPESGDGPVTDMVPAQGPTTE